MMRNRYSRKEVIRFLQFQEDMPHLFLSKEDELNGEFWGPEDEDYYDKSSLLGFQKHLDFQGYNDNLKSDEF